MNLLTELLPTQLDRTFIETAPFGGAPDQRLSYGDVATSAARYAAALESKGVRPGDRIVIQVDKSVDALALMLGCLHARVVFIPLNTAYTAAEVEYFVSDADARLVVASPDHGPALREALGADVDIVEFDGGVRGVGTFGALASALEPVAGPPLDGDGADAAAMLYTSGTTGRSKGAVLTHDSLLSNARVLHDAWAIEPDDTICHTLPIFHVHGLFVAIFPLMLEGATVRFRDKFDIDDVISQLPTCSVLMGVPTHYVRLLTDERFDRDLCSHVRLFTSGSAPMTEQVHGEFTARTGRHIVERYGMTETGILTTNPLADGGQVPGSVGYALAGHELRVVDEHGRQVATGESGQVEVLTPVPFAGYWKQPDKTAEATTEDGWFRTGDVGSLDETGRLRLDGRASDMIISGGYNVYPKEIEMVLDAVDGVVESAVFGVPHPDFGETVVAVVVTVPGADAAELESTLDAACRAELARFKHPRHYEFIDELPRNSMAKVVKNGLRQRYRTLFA